MTNFIARHSIDATQFPDLLKRAQKRLANFIELVLTTDSLTYIYECANEIAIYGICTDQPTPLVSDAIKTSGRALAAFFKAAVYPTEETRFDVDGGKLVTTRGPCNESKVHGGRWLDGFWMNVLARHNQELLTMCDVPDSLLRRSSTTGPRFTEDLIQVLQSFCLQSQEIKQNITVAREHVDESNYDWFRLCGRNYLDLIEIIVTSSGNFNDRLFESAKDHKKYWTKTSDRRCDWNGYIAKELSALASIAFDRGMKIEVESDYLPVPLITGEILQTST